MTADDLVRAPAVLRAGRIVEMIAGASGSAIGVSELARRLDIPKSSVSNICAPLEQLGVLERTATGYVLGSKLAYHQYLPFSDDITIDSIIARPTLQTVLLHKHNVALTCLAKWRGICDSKVP